MRLFSLCVFVLCLFAGCKSADPIMDQNLRRAWTVRDEDKRRVVSDEEYKAMSEEQKKNAIPQSLEDARIFEKENAFKYADSLK